VPATERAAVLERAADLLEERMLDLVALIVREGGRTYADAVSEVREAVDFCRYYAVQAKINFAEPKELAGPAGERNELRLHGRGVFACISPWNFPLSIFTGQVAAGLAAGNTVIAKPAEQTPRIGFESVKIFREAGVPEFVVQCVAGDAEVGAPLVADPRIAGVAFTARWRPRSELISRWRSARADRAAHRRNRRGQRDDRRLLGAPEQVVDDVVISAFQSAGSAARRSASCSSTPAARRACCGFSPAPSRAESRRPGRAGHRRRPHHRRPFARGAAAHIAKLRASARLIGEAR